MTWISDGAMARLRDSIDLPDLSGTKYRLVKRLGRGGMGTVYLAEDTTLARQVALKVVEVAGESATAAQRLRQEARVIAQLEHPGIVPVHDVGELVDGRMYYTMKYVQGQRLDHFARQVQTISERLRVFQKICEAVAFAHANSVLHRDLKPENIMVGAFGEVLVLDWGVAKLLPSPTVPAPDSQGGVLVGSDKENTSAGTIVGTPVYMSPEQARGGAIDERTDVFGLGAVLYFLLTKRPPMAATNVTDPIQRPRVLDPKISKGLDAICMKALAYEPAGRFASVVALSADIARLLDDQPISAYSENMLERIDRWVARNRFLVILILAYLLMRILLLITSGR